MNEEMGASGLLRNAAKLIARAALKLDTAEAPCPHCCTSLFENLDHGRVAQQIVNLPTKLRDIANRLDNVSETPHGSHGFGAARRQYLERGLEGPTFESEAYELLGEALGEVRHYRGAKEQGLADRIEQFLKVAGKLAAEIAATSRQGEASR